MSTQLWTHCRRWLHQLSDDRSGVTAIEYGLIAASVAVAIVATIILVGDELIVLYTYISDEIAGAGSS